MENNYNFEFEIYTDETGEKWVWIGTENATGAEYKANTPEQLGEAMAFYMTCYYPEIFK